MNQEILRKVRCAYDNFNKQDIIERDIINYIRERIIDNKENYENLIEIQEEKFSFDDIVEAIFEVDKFKCEINKISTLFENNFISSVIANPKGTIVIECFDTLEVIKYFMYAIKTKNAILISDVEYDEYSIKCYTLEIIREALKKFNVDENLISIFPYEEIDYKKFDEVIYTYDNDGELLEKSEYFSRSVSEKLYIYMQDSMFEEEINSELKKLEMENKSVEVLTGDIGKVIEQINGIMCKGAVIYTREPEVAYEFINLVNSYNVFVNASVRNIKENNKIINNEWYYSKNIIFPIPNITPLEFQEIEEQIGQDGIDKTLIENENSIEEIDEDKVKALSIRREGILEKIRGLLRRFLK